MNATEYSSAVEERTEESEVQTTSCQSSVASGQSLSRFDHGVTDIPAEERRSNDQETPSDSGASNKGGTRLTDEEVSILTNFITQTPEGEAN